MSTASSSETGPMDWAYVRAQFPGLTGEVALMDNAGGSVPALAVIDAIGDYLQHDMVQLGASYARSERAGERVTAGKVAAARMLGAAPEDVVLGDSTTANMFVLAPALAGHVGEGDEIVVTDLDHEANVGAWVRLAEARGATLRTWAVDRDTHRLTLHGLDAVLTDRTRIVAFTHCANVVGAIHDAKAFCARVREAGALSVVDGVAYAPHRRVDAPSLGADVYAFSFYKVYGPHLGALYVDSSLQEGLRNQNHFFLEDSGSYRLMPGNVSHELAAGLPGVVDYLEQLDRHHGGDGDLAGAWDRIRGHEAALAEPLIAFLDDHPKVRLIGERSADADRRVPTIAFTVEGRRSSSVPPELDDHTAIRWGHFYAYRAMEAFGLDPDDGIIRISMVHYNTGEEVRRLIARLDQIL